jgi:CRISPR-associated protein Cas2
VSGVWHYLIAYDIRHPRRLRRVAKIMENYGMRVQKSIFEAALSATDLQALQLDLAQVLELEEDGVKFFPLCERCSRSIGVLGHSVDAELFQPLLVL